MMRWRLTNSLMLGLMLRLAVVLLRALLPTLLERLRQQGLLPYARPLRPTLRLLRRLALQPVEPPPPAQLLLHPFLQRRFGGGLKIKIRI